MAQKTLRPRREILKQSVKLALAGAVGVGVIACSRRPSNRPKRYAIGLIRRWESTGSGVQITHFGDKQGEPPYDFGDMLVTQRATKEETYFPGDVQGIPKRIEVRWLWNVKSTRDHPEITTYAETIAEAKPASAFFDLHSLIPQATIEELSSRPGGVIKLIFTFNDDKLDLSWETKRVDPQRLGGG